MENPRYLGDGVYAEFKDGGIWLLANDHKNPTDRIFLDPSVLFSLDRFTEEIKGK